MRCKTIFGKPVINWPEIAIKHAAGVDRDLQEIVTHNTIEGDLAELLIMNTRGGFKSGEDVKHRVAVAKRRVNVLHRTCTRCQDFISPCGIDWITTGCHMCYSVVKGGRSTQSLNLGIMNPQLAQPGQMKLLVNVEF